MSESKFSCPHCGQRIACDEAWSGQPINCPVCQQVIVVPSGVAASPSLPAEVRASSPEPAGTAPAQAVVSRTSTRQTIGYVGLSLTLVVVALWALGVHKRLRAPVVDFTASRASPPAEAVPARPAPAPKPVPAPEAVAAPIIVTPVSFTAKGPGKIGGFSYRLENRADKPVARVVLIMELRDADGVLENRVPNRLMQGMSAKATTEEKSDAFFLTERTRSVTFSVEEVTFADGSRWSQREAALAATPPGALSFGGHAAPASVEVVRFRPKTAPDGILAYRLVNHSNKAIERFTIKTDCLDAAGNPAAEAVDFSMRFDPDLAIPPGGTFEGGSEFVENPFQDYGGDKTHSVRITVQSLAFIGGEKRQVPDGK